MILKNKLGIENQIELAKKEEKITKLKAKKLFETGKLNFIEVGTFKGLSEIHKYLFEDIYDFAGKIRTENISKSNFRFASAMYLKEALNRIWLDMILKEEIGKVIDWSKVNKEDYLLAMERSPIKDTEIKILLGNALTNMINDREIYMKGIDASYNYEGYCLYNTEDIAE